MRRFLPILLLSIACNDTLDSKLTFSGGSIQEVVLHANFGSIHVRHAAKGEDAASVLLLMKESGGAETLGAEKRLQVTQTNRRLRIQQRRNENGLRLDMELVVPKGVTVDIVLRDGNVRIEGEFTTVAVVVTNGNIEANLGTSGGVKLQARVGDVSLQLRKSTPTRGIICETLSGNVSIELPPSFRGPINLSSAAKKLDFGNAPKVAFMVDADRTSARGLAGTPMSADERVAAEKFKRWPPGVRGKTQTGTMKFRVRD